MYKITCMPNYIERCQQQPASEAVGPSLIELDGRIRRNELIDVGVVGLHSMVAAKHMNISSAVFGEFR